MNQYHVNYKIFLLSNYLPKSSYIAAEFTQKIRQHYYAAVTYIDDLFGQIITTMKQQKLLDNTVIVFFGDHGEQNIFNNNKIIFSVGKSMFTNLFGFGKFY